MPNPAREKPKPDDPITVLAGQVETVAYRYGVSPTVCILLSEYVADRVSELLAEPVRL